MVPFLTFLQNHDLNVEVEGSEKKGRSKRLSICGSIASNRRRTRYETYGVPLRYLRALRSLEQERKQQWKRSVRRGPRYRYISVPRSARLYHDK